MIATRMLRAAAVACAVAAVAAPVAEAAAGVPTRAQALKFYRQHVNALAAPAGQSVTARDARCAKPKRGAKAVRCSVTLTLSNGQVCQDADVRVRRQNGKLAVRNEQLTCSAPTVVPTPEPIAPAQPAPSAAPATPSAPAEPVTPAAPSAPAQGGVPGLPPGVTPPFTPDAPPPGIEPPSMPPTLPPSDGASKTTKAVYGTFLGCTDYFWNSAWGTYLYYCVWDNTYYDGYYYLSLAGWGGSAYPAWYWIGDYSF